MVLPKIEKKLRTDTPKVGVAPYGQIHPHSTGNSRSTAQNEVDNQYNNKPVAFFTHVVGNGRIIQIAPVGRGAYDVGGGWNYETYAAVELIESHKTKEEFLIDYKIYVELLRALADEAGIPKKVDCQTKGINTHDYCRLNQPNNGTDHVDPYPYLAKWGISKAQFKKDVENGLDVLAKNTKPVSNGKVGDKVKVYDALYADSTGKDRSTSKRGSTGTIKKIEKGASKPYFVENWGWAHANDIQLVEVAKKPDARYYQKEDNNSLFELLKDDYVYNSMDFNSKTRRRVLLKKGTRIYGREMRDYNGITRMHTALGYLTSAKVNVKKVWQNDKWYN